MANDRIGIGFIGAGGIAKQRHLPGLKAIPGVELVAVANRRRETAEEIAKEWGFATVKDDWREILDMKEVDAVFIAAPPALHKIATLAALQAGKHVFCQARMALNYADAKEMYDASTRVNLRTMLCPPPHAMESDFVVKRLLKEGFIGRPLDVHVYGIMSTYADSSAPLHWRQDAAVSGINTLFLGMYAEVIHRWLGPHKSIYAVTKVHYPLRQRPGTNEIAEVKIADSIVAAGELENGAVSSWHVMGTAHHPSPNQFELYGTEGTLIVSASVTKGDIKGAKKGQQLAQIPIDQSELRQWTAEADFIHAIRDGGPVSPDFYEGLKYMEFTEAVYRSSREGRAISLPMDRVAASAT